MERGVAGVMVSTPTTMKGRDTLSKSTVCGVASRANVEKDMASPANMCIKNPNSSLNLNFEQQIKEIDDAINGSVPSLNSVTNQELLVGKESIAQVRNVAIMEREERMNEKGPYAVDQAHSTMLGPQEMLHKPMHVSEEILGLIQAGVNFSLGLSSPKQHKAQGVKKNRGGSLKKNKENRGVSGKENKSRSKEIQFHGVENNEDSIIEIELVDMRIKRRARTPLSELENKEDNGKRIKRESEVKELGKLLAQHMGSAEAASQPRRAQ